MGTVTKTIRIDEDLLAIVEDYNKLVKEMFGASPTVNGVLANAVVHGLEDNLQFFRVLNSNMMVSIKPGEGQKMNDEIKEKAKALVEKYEVFVAEFENSKDDSNEEDK